MDSNSSPNQQKRERDLPDENWSNEQYFAWIKEVALCSDAEAYQICSKFRIGDWFKDRWRDTMTIGISAVLPQLPIDVLVRFQRVRADAVKALLERGTASADDSKITVSRVLEAVVDGRISGELLKLQLEKKLLQLRGETVKHPCIHDLDFPLPLGIERPTTWMNMEQPPFFNRQRAVLKLLHDCYLNYGQIERSGDEEAKPLAAILGTTAGYGKTRLLLEWAIRAFHDENILYSFLVDSTPLTSVDTNPKKLQKVELSQKECPYSFEDLYAKFAKPPYDPEFNQDRVEFLHTLKNTLKRSLIITSNSPDITNVEDVNRTVDILCRKIVVCAISDRFDGRKFTINGKIINIAPLEVDKNGDRNFLEENNLLLPGVDHRELISLLSLFVHLVLHDYPKQDDENALLLLINIDESQRLLEVRAGLRTLAFEVIKLFYEVAAKLRGKPNKLDIRFFVFMTGLATRDAKLLEDATALWVDLTVPLNPLLKYEYCDAVIQSIYCKEGSALTKVNPSKAGKEVIQSLWLRCLGIPRAVQILHRLLNTTLGNIIQNKVISTENEKEILKEFHNKTQKYFQSRPPTSYNVPDDVWENLTIECCLGLERNATDKIAKNVEVTYSQLEEQGAIFPIEFNEFESDAKIPRRYAMPFLYFNMLKKPLASLASLPSSSTLVETFTPVIGDIVGSAKADGLQQQGDNLEQACATSLWARYKMLSQAGEFVNLKDIVPSWPKDDHFVCLSGVGRPKRKIEAKDLKNYQTSAALKQAQCVVINMQSSHFADVIVPVVIGTEAKDKIMKIKEQIQQLDVKTLHNEQQCQKKRQHESDALEQSKKLKDALLASTVFLLIQCHNMKADNSKIGPSHIAEELSSQSISDFLDKGHFYVLMAPNLPSSTLIDRADSEEVKAQLTKYKDNLIETNGKGWLGELFLIINTGMKKERRKKKDNEMDERQNFNDGESRDETETTSSESEESNPEVTKKSKNNSNINEEEKSNKDTGKSSDEEAPEEILVQRGNNNNPKKGQKGKKSLQTKGSKRQAQKRKHEQTGSSEEEKKNNKKLKINK